MAPTVNTGTDNDNVSLNPPGRQTFDDRLLKIRGKVLKIGTWNVRTLFKAGQYDNLKVEMEDMKLDILGISETRWSNEGKISEKDYTMVYSGAEKHQYGVGIMMKSSIADSMIGYWPVSDRIIMMKLAGKPTNINIIQVYAPTQDHSDEELEKFYDNISDVMEYTKSGDITIILGDWNAKIGKHHEYPVTGHHGLGETNKRGLRLIDFCRTSNMTIANTLFQHPNR